MCFQNRFQCNRSEQADSHISLKNFKLQEGQQILTQWSLKSIKEVQMRRYILKKTALEIFFLDGESVLINFPCNDTDCEDVSSKLIRNRKKRCPNIVYHHTLDPRKLVDKSGITGRWLNREISNFEYLMQLNSFASRSYKDVTQYPVFPWVVTEYGCSDFSLTTARDLSKSMGSLGSRERMRTFQERFLSNNSSSSIPPFHFGSHYSSPAIVFNYLARLQPFTEGMRILQSKQLESSSKLFCSMEEAFRSASEDVSDVRELIPEFFYLPELFLNMNREDLGFRQGKQRVDNIQLPMWSDLNPYKFVVLHRQALESERVSATINDWIDLIFGYKQAGKESEKNLNVFYHLSYEDKVDLDKIKDKSIREQTETQIINFGQTPIQLFCDRPHPQREPLPEGRLFADPQAEIKVFRPSTGKKKKTLNLNKQQRIVDFFSKDMPDEAIVSLKWLSDSRFLSIKRNGLIAQFRWYNHITHQNQQSVIPFQCGEDKKREITFDKPKKGHINLMDESISYSEFPCFFLKDSKVIVFGGMWDGSIKLTQIDSKELVELYTEHTTTVTCLKADSKENFIFTGSKNGEVIMWKIHSGFPKLSVRFKYYDHSDYVTQICISKDLLVFATSSADSTINLYNFLSGQFYRTFNHPSSIPIDNVILGNSPLPCVLFFSSGDRTLYSYSLNGQLLAKTLEESNVLTSSLVLKDSFFSEIIVLGNDRGDLILRELPFLQLKKSFNVSIQSPVLSLVLSKDRKFLLCGCSDGYISVLTDPLTNKYNSSSPASVRQQEMAKLNSLSSREASFHN